MLIFTLVGVCLMLFTNYKSASTYYFYCVWLGLGTGYWAMFVTIGAEHFGTNLRATAATTIPNMVRGMVVPMVFCFDQLKLGQGVIVASVWVGIAAFGLAIYSILTIPETHGKDLNFLEE